MWASALRKSSYWNGSLAPSGSGFMSPCQFVLSSLNSLFICSTLLSDSDWQGLVIRQ